MLRWLILIGFCWHLHCLAQYAENELQAKQEYNNYIIEHSRHFTSGKNPLHFLKWGDLKDTPIIWLHGSYSNAFEIEPLAKSIIALNYSLIAIEYYGHGQTAIPAKHVSVDDFLDDVKILLDSLKIEKYIVGGFSRGAYLATMLYQRDSSRVKALILEDGGVSPFLENLTILSNEELESWLKNELASRPEALFRKFDHEYEAYSSLKPFGETQQNQLFKNFSFIRKSKDKFLIYNDIDRLFGMSNLKAIKRLMKGKLYSHPFANDLMTFPFYEVIQHSKIPTLLLEASSADDLFRQSHYYIKLKKENPNIIHRTFTESTHNIHVEQPDAFNESIITFLKQLQNDD